MCQVEITQRGQALLRVATSLHVLSPPMSLEPETWPPVIGGSVLGPLVLPTYCTKIGEPEIENKNVIQTTEDNNGWFR